MTQPNGVKPVKALPAAARWLKPDVRPKLAELMGSKCDMQEVAAFQKACLDAARAASSCWRGGRGSTVHGHATCLRTYHLVPFKPLLPTRACCLAAC